MAMKSPSEVAKRCLCLELLLQRLGLELDEDDPVTERDAVRRAWLSRLGQLGVEEALSAGERDLLERGVGALTEDECDDIEQRVVGALFLLWSMTRLGARPTDASLGIATRLMADYGILGDGSILAAKATIANVALRPEHELRDAMAACTQEAGGSETVSPSDVPRWVAAVGGATLAWILNDSGAT
jgi:hypothetical protein